MQIFFTIFSIITLLLGIYVVVFNWGAVIANFRLQRKGISRHISPVFFAAQILVCIAALFSSRSTVVPIPLWVFWFVALADLALWKLLYFLIFLLLDKWKSHSR
ncbi:MAG: hypothetical protein LBF51_10755 [Zoogloeaceae bacterium]|jgi:hypothetical protein|nr:hypothetical protein [Zoogloeaceae bacterium]